jgi:hypothetical protein
MCMGVVGGGLVTYLYKPTTLISPGIDLVWLYFSVHRTQTAEIMHRILILWQISLPTRRR